MQYAKYFCNELLFFIETHTRVITTLLENDIVDCSETLEAEVIERIDKVIKFYCLPTSLRPSGSKDIEVIAEAAFTIRAVLLNCSKLRFSKATNKLINPMSCNKLALCDLMEGILPHGNLSIQMIKQLQNIANAGNCNLEMDLKSAYRIISLVRLLLEIENILFSEGGSTQNLVDRFAQTDFIYNILLILVEKEINFIIDSKGGASTRSKSVRRIGEMLRVLSLVVLSLSDLNQQELDSKLLQFFTPKFHSFLSEENFDYLYYSIVSTDSLSKTRAYFILHSCDEIKLKETEMAILKIQQKIADAEVPII